MCASPLARNELERPRIFLDWTMWSTVTFRRTVAAANSDLPKARQQCISKTQWQASRTHRPIPSRIPAAALAGAAAALLQKAISPAADTLPPTLSRCTSARRRRKTPRHQLRVRGLPKQGSSEPREKPAGLLAGAVRRVAVLLRRGTDVCVDEPITAAATAGGGLAAAGVLLALALPRRASGSAVSAMSMSSSHRNTRSVRS